MADGPDPNPDPLHDLAALRAERDAWAQELFESNRYAAELAIARHALADALATAESRARAQAEADALRAIEAARKDRDAALTERDRALEAEARLQRITSSTTWRMTAPLRALVAALLGRPRSDL